MQLINKLLVIMLAIIMLVFTNVNARFLSNDPVSAQTHIQKGNLQGFNRYAYANNNPFKYIDPDGRDSIITYKKNGDLNIQIPIKFSGSGASSSNINSIKSQISETWSGTYNINGKDVQVSVNVTDVKSTGPKNEITLVDGPTSDSTGDSYVQGNKGEWRTDGKNLTDGSISHEAGHLFGASDKYLPNGTPLPGHKDNIMADPSGKPKASAIQEAIRDDDNWHDK